MSMPLLPDDFDSGTAPMKAVYRAGYNANNFGGFPDNPVVKKRKKLAKDPRFVKAKGIKPTGPSSVGYRNTPLPGSSAAIPRGGDVPTKTPPGQTKQLRERGVSSNFLRAKSVKPFPGTANRPNLPQG